MNGLKNYVVLYRRKEDSPLDSPQGFQCYADDVDHAEEQCLDAYPACDIVWVWQGKFGVGIEPALANYYSASI